jgi:hypothetical protein
MSSNPDNRSAKGPIIAGAVLSALVLTPVFGAASQAINNAMAPDTSNVALSSEDELGMDGYYWLRDQGYGNVGGIEGAKSGQYDSHITLVRTNKDKDGNISSQTFWTTEPGSLNWEYATVKYSDPANPKLPQNPRVVNVTVAPSNAIDALRR